MGKTKITEVARKKLDTPVTDKELQQVMEALPTVQIYDNDSSERQRGTYRLKKAGEQTCHNGDARLR